MQRWWNAGKGGKVINVASIGALIGWPNMSAYCASKGGCLQLTKVMALEWARYNIQVNAILPGICRNTHEHGILCERGRTKGHQSSIPMKRIWPRSKR